MLQPRVQHDIRRSGYAFGPHLAGCGTEQRQQLGCTAANVLVRLAHRLALRSPGLAWLGNGLVWTSFILTPDGNTREFSGAIGQFDQPLFTSVSGSTTVTTPALRLRCAVPVGHHVRVRWYELPASCSTRRIVLLPTCGKPARRSVRCNVLNDHVAVSELAYLVLRPRRTQAWREENELVGRTLMRGGAWLS